MATTAYIEVEDAQDYFDERLATAAWEDATDDDKLKALKQATRQINRLQFVGQKTDDDQDNEFPRGGDADVPESIKQATCELALQLLDEIDTNMEIENLSVNAQKFDKIGTNYNRDFVMAHIRAGIPSIEAWELLCPFLADPLTVRLVRK